MPVEPPDEAADLVAFLEANVDFTGVSADPAALEVDHPNYDGGVDTPGIRVHSPETDLPGSGPTGYSGMDPGGGGGTQDPRTTLQVDCWGGTINDADVLTAHPAVVAGELRSEVWGTVLDASDASTVTTGPLTDYRSIGVRDGGTGHDTDAEPTEFRQILFVGLTYHLRPA